MVERLELKRKIGDARGRVRDLEQRLRDAAPQAGAQVEEALALLNRELEALESQADELEPTVGFLELIVTAADTDEMIRRAAAFVKEWSGVEAVGVRLREGNDFPYFTTLGFPDSFVAAESSLLTVNGGGRPRLGENGEVVLECMCGKVIRGKVDPSRTFFTEGGSFWTNGTTELLSVSEPDELGPVRSHCSNEGYESVALVPLRGHGETFGLIQLNDRRPDCFTLERVRVMEHLADYLAAALE